MKTITESMNRLKGSGCSIFPDVIQGDDFHVVYLLALSSCNIQKMRIKLWEQIKSLPVYIKRLAEQDLPRFYGQISFVCRFKKLSLLW